MDGRELRIGEIAIAEQLVSLGDGLQPASVAEAGRELGQLGVDARLRVVDGPGLRAALQPRQVGRLFATGVRQG